MSRNKRPKALSIEDKVKKRIDDFGGRSIGGLLHLGGFGLSTVPEGLRTLVNLRGLVLTGNRIRELPGWIGELTSLRILDLDGNQLRTLPPEIGSMTHLEALFLARNPLVDLPRELIDLPLTHLGLHAVLGLGLPQSLVKGEDAQEILRYYFESRNEKGAPLRELKLLVVGRGKAGKTTLIKRLAGEVVDDNESETHSISIRELTFECRRGLS